MNEPRPPIDFGPQPGETWEHVWDASEGKLNIQLCHKVNVLERNSSGITVRQWTSPDASEKYPAFILSPEEMKNYRRVDNE